MEQQFENAKLRAKVLFWEQNFNKSKVFANPGEVISIEYQVENISDKKSTGLATFAYYPKSFGIYIIKLKADNLILTKKLIIK